MYPLLARKIDVEVIDRPKAGNAVQVFADSEFVYNVG